MNWPGEVGEPCLVPSGEGDKGMSPCLHAVLYAPEGTARGNVCLVSALFEEKRSAHRTMVDFARALGRAGWWVLHPDLAGNGNSPGDLTTLAVEDWISNVVDSVAYLRARSGVTLTALVGVRAGALIAGRAAGVLDPPPAMLHLWQPVIDGGKYLSQMQTRRRIQDGLTGREEGEAEEVGGVMDVDGFAVGPALYAGLQALRLAEETLPAGMPVQILQISARDRLLPDYQALQVAWGERAAVQVQTARPFWNPHTPDRYDDVIVPAVAWLSGER
jgi:pimeloyl-ACP methyl ester carboxylesterase